MTTMLVLLRELAARLEVEGSALTGTATSGTSTTLVDTTEPGLYYTDGDPNLFDRWFVYNELSGAIGRVDVDGLGGSTGTLTLTGGEFGAEGTANAAVSTTTAGGTGTLTDTRVSWVTDQWVGATVTCNSETMVVTSNTSTVLTGTGDWSGDPGDGKEWAMTGVCPYIITSTSPSDQKKTINRVLRNDLVESWFPLSVRIVQNDANDMEASTVATDYELTTGAAAAAIETTNVYSGSQSLKLTCDNANEYAALKSVIPVNEDQRLHAAAMCSVTQGDDAAFRIWNVQSVEIDSATSDEPAWMNLQPPAFTIPSGCEQIDLRLEGIGSDDVIFWDEVQVWYDGEGIYPLPSYITSTAQLLDVRAIPRGTAGPGSDEDYRTNEQASYSLNPEWESKNPNSMRIKVSCGSARPYLVTLRPRPELSTDSATTTANENVVVSRAEKLIREPEKASEYLGIWRAAALMRPVTTPPIGSAGVRIDEG